MKVLSHKSDKAELQLRFVLPNLFTAASLCAGMTALLFAADGRMQMAVLSVILAAVFDACDGRIARMMGTTSRFGCELDSLADVVSFGAAPAFILHCWGLSQFGVPGWLPCLAFATCCALRLARFNVAAQVAGTPLWKANYFAGIPAPAGAFLALAPLSAEFSGFMDNAETARLALFTTPIIAGLMISTWPTFSGKSLGRKTSRLMLLPPIALAGFAGLGLLNWPWATLLGMAVFYVCTLPLSKWRYEILQARVQPPQGHGTRRPNPIAR